MKKEHQDFWEWLFTDMRPLGAGMFGFSAYGMFEHEPLVAPIVISSVIAGAEIGGCFGTVKIGDDYVDRWYANNGSFKNFIGLKNQSIRWTPFSKISYFLPSKKRDDNFYVDNFRFEDEQIKYKLNFLNKILANRAEKQDRHMSWDMLKKGSLILGSMGQGKTEFLNNIIVQWIDTNRKMVIHDTKGEFTSWYYRKGKDYIINHLDRRGVYWDFFEDNEKGLPYPLISEFFQSYFIAVAGDKGDKFWQEMAGKRFKEVFEELKLQNDVPSHEKMEILAKELLAYLSYAKASGNKTEQSIASTLEASLDIFLKFAYMAKNERRKILLTEFFKSEDSRIFLHTIAVGEKDNAPFITAFLTVMMRYQLTYFDKAPKEQWILYVLDEYLTFFEKMSEDIRRSVHTKARSYGMLLLPALQYLPSDEKLKEVLTGSIENMWIFAGTNSDTNDEIKKMTGKVQINDVSKKKDDKYDETLYTQKEHYLLSDNILKEMEPGEHISFFPKKSVIYFGYTEQVEVKPISKDYIEEKKEENSFIQFKRELAEKAEKEIKKEIEEMKQDISETFKQERQQKLFGN
ncbi:type IV secretion system DNA-binding domain-containing protein [Nitratiruptor sp. SB155-2]|uniref:type IV secretion system DNA-binding domain-containing protein n=1 Tax=Nitratiruptor sp. (strain SB155-2) TaxID=387092 RepID=UPI0001586FA4|nr:type IV secretion system DNA-binding domain-containing protein [Nitratiruptor sp. SB155-2]BAF70793.1 conserved hypothetical protein [Nitratiruptor sp. SB155-2]